MNGISIVLVECDDYFWLYVEGKKTKYCGHKCEPTDIVGAINDYIKENSSGSHLCSVCGINFETYCVSDEYIEDNCCDVPDLLKDIPESAYE